MSKPIKDRTHAELIALSRENADRYEARAAEHEAQGEASEAEKLREWARRSREEADQQEAWAAARPKGQGETCKAERSGWRWFAGSNEEFYHVGPCGSREEAVATATGNWPGESFHLIEARQDPIDLAGCVSVDSMVEQLHESLGDEFGGEDGESPADGAWTDAQHADLERAITSTVRAWQSRHGIVVTPRAFTASRNAEIVVPAEVVAINVTLTDTPIAPEMLAALTAKDTAITCFGCGVAMKDGDPYYEDVNEGPMHAACCGPEPEAFVGSDGEPLKAGDAIPAPGIYRSADL